MDDPIHTPLRVHIYDLFTCVCMLQSIVFKMIEECHSGLTVALDAHDALILDVLNA